VVPQLPFCLSLPNEPDLNIRLPLKNHLKSLDIIHGTVYNSGEEPLIKSAVYPEQTAFIGLLIHDIVLNTARESVVYQG